jgi:arylsulfatase A-like enzyme
MLRWLDSYFKATPLVIIANFGLAMICATADAALPRDIVLLMADDVGCSDVACSPTMGLPLPNVARLAARGVTVTKASSSGPACVPTRVGTILGEYQQRSRVYTNAPEGASYYPLPLQKVTLAENLKAKGYATALIGKYPIQNTFTQLPLQNGYDRFRGILINGQKYVNSSGGGTGIYYDNVTQRVQQVKHLTLAFQDHAVAFLRANAGRPRFLHLALTAPHLPYQYTASQFARCSTSTVPVARRPFCAMMVGVDDALGAVMAELGPDAMVIYVGDNGFESESNMPTPYRGDKGTPYEGGVRVPFVASWPGVLPQGVRYNFPVSTLDLYATMTYAAVPGTPAARLDSVNLIPYLKDAITNPRPTQRRYYFYTTHDAIRSVRSGPWKLYSFKSGARVELYNTDANPGETVNVAGVPANQTLVAGLRQVLAGWRATLPPPF